MKTPPVSFLGRLAGVFFLACTVVVARAAEPSPTPKPPRTPESAITPGRENLKRHGVFLSRINDGPVGVVFLGDSITDGWPKIGELTWLKLAPYDPANFGISGETTEQVLWRITNGELEGIDPKAVVIMIGTNNLGHFADEKPEWVAAGISKIVDTVREKVPKAKVLLLAVFPRAQKDSPLRQRVDAVNAILAQTDFGPQVKYLDIGAKFLDEKGEIPQDVMPDGLHPNAKGYRIWYAELAPILEEWVK